MTCFSMEKVSGLGCNCSECEADMDLTKLENYRAQAALWCTCGHAFKSHVRGYYVGPCRSRAKDAPKDKRIPAPCKCTSFLSMSSEAIQ